MEYTEISNMITGVGFPIAMCIMFFIWFTNSYKQEQESTREIIAELKETVIGLKATVETLTALANAHIKTTKKGGDEE